MSIKLRPGKKIIFYEDETERVLVDGPSSPYIDVTDTTNTVTTRIQSDDSKGYVGTSTNHAFDIRTNGTARVSIANSGAITITPATTFSGNVTLSAAATPTLTITDTTNTVSVIVKSDDTKGYVGTSTNHACDILTNNTARIAIAAGGAVTVTPAATFTAGAQSASVAVTATSDGLTTGLIPSGTRYVTVTSANANDIVTLPTAVVGNRIDLYVGANGCELRTPATSNVKINNVDSDGTNEAAIPATTYCQLVCVSTTEWILLAWDELGAPITAIVPDAA